MSSIGETVVGNIESGRYDNYKWFGRLPKYIEEHMERMRNDPALMYGRSEIQVVVAGEPGTGKSSLIHNACCLKFRGDGEDGYGKFRGDGEDDGYATDVGHYVVLEPKRLPHHFHPKAFRLPVIVLDTGLDDEENVEKLKQADIVLLTFGCGDLKTLAKLSDIWIPGLDRLQVKAPIMLVGCKADLKEKGLDLNRKCFHLGEKENVVQLAILMRHNRKLLVNLIECSAYH
ncbi:hypothetical protein FEM48_Zijuj06G0187700 [Ziziphus jujuba var. spinosa]|uniref:Uncharacterized protein n=1 Tax=Ziziphus jujuba var. spinosa TaxID=714518 RepID=A0A978VB01_ZIZJJ|nr:hypothetical protein FEM48_Zijuj06G0187700 [Ziziphus jujuba var. spinosa]